MERPVMPKPEPLEQRGESDSGKMKLPSGYIIYAVIVVVALIASFGVNYLFGTSKSDIETFKTETQSRVDALSSDLRASTSSIKTALDGIPATINTKADASFSQYTSKMASLEKDMEAMQDELADGLKEISGFNSKLEANIGNLVGQINALKADIEAVEASVGEIDLSSLATKVANIETQLTTVKSDITAMKTDIVILQNQYSLTTIAVNTGVINYSVTTGVPINIPVSVTNSGSVNISAPLKVVLTTAGVVTLTSTPAMDRTHTISVSGTTITFYLNVFVPANSTITINQLVTVTYTGTSPNTWTATWSKQ